MNKIKIYGERNSGTIYLEWLIHKNLVAEVVEGFEFGWKHRIAPAQDELSDLMKNEILFLCLVKNPYSWLLSMHKRPYQHEILKDINFSEFIRYSYGDYKNPVVLWNMKNRSYMELGKNVRQHMIVKYEDILRDPKTKLDQIAEKFSIEKPGLFINIQKLLTNKHGIRNEKFHTEYYLKETWRKKLHRDQINYINNFLDQDLMQKFDYPLL
jgi:hypothetical protein